MMDDRKKDNGGQMDLQKNQLNEWWGGRTRWVEMRQEMDDSKLLVPFSLEPDRWRPRVLL